jgi:hypothetical protein
MKSMLVVIYRKRTNGKFYLITFANTHVDEILNSRKKKPLLPYSYEIEAIGVGSNFVNMFKRKYNIK